MDGWINIDYDKFCIVYVLSNSTLNNDYRSIDDDDKQCNINNKKKTGNNYQENKKKNKSKSYEYNHHHHRYRNPSNDDKKSIL